MKSVSISNNKAKGLNAYLRQACLSVHRAEGRDSLVRYYRDSVRLMPRDLLGYLPKVNLDAQVYEFSEARKLVCSWKFRARHALLSGVEWRIKNVVEFPVLQWSYILESLDRFNRLLLFDGELGKEAIVSTRMNLDTASDFIGLKMPRNVRRRVYNLNHLNQSSHLLSNSIEEICGADWYY